MSDADCTPGREPCSVAASFMVALWNKADHYIFALWFPLFFFPHLISAVADWMSAIILRMMWT